MKDYEFWEWMGPKRGFEKPKNPGALTPQDDIAFIQGKLPKKGDVVRLKKDGVTKVFRSPADFPYTGDDLAAANIDWQELVGGIIKVLSWLERILLIIQGMLPPKQKEE